MICVFKNGIVDRDWVAEGRACSTCRFSYRNNQRNSLGTGCRSNRERAGVDASTCVYKSHWMPVDTEQPLPRIWVPGASVSCINCAAYTPGLECTTTRGGKATCGGRTGGGLGFVLWRPRLEPAAGRAPLLVEGPHAEVFVDIRQEYREYRKVVEGVDSLVLRIDGPIWLCVEGSGHRIVDASGVCYYMPYAQYTYIKWRSEEGTPHFKL